jgi:hypothetical protein
MKSTSDVALMQFVREAWLLPIADRPFTFALNLILQKPPSDASYLFQIRPTESERRLRVAAVARACLPVT